MPHETGLLCEQDRSGEIYVAGRVEAGREEDGEWRMEFERLDGWRLDVNEVDPDPMLCFPPPRQRLSISRSRPHLDLAQPSVHGHSSTFNPAPCPGHLLPHSRQFV